MWLGSSFRYSESGLTIFSVVWVVPCVEHHVRGMYQDITRAFDNAVHFVHCLSTQFIVAPKGRFYGNGSNMNGIEFSAAAIYPQSRSPLTFSFVRETKENGDMVI